MRTACGTTHTLKKWNPIYIASSIIHSCILSLSTPLINVYWAQWYVRDLPGTRDAEVTPNTRMLLQRSSLFSSGLLGLVTTDLWDQTVMVKSSPGPCRMISTIPASTHYMEAAALSVTIRNVQRHCQNPLGGKLAFISNWLYLTAPPLYLCHHTQIINHITPIVHMITQAQYVWHHTNTYDITSTLYDITPHCDIYTHCIHVITPRIPVIASTVARPLLIVYWLYHTYCMCDMKPTICITSEEFYLALHSLFIT